MSRYTWTARPANDYAVILVMRKHWKKRREQRDALALVASIHLPAPRPAFRLVKGGAA